MAAARPRKTITPDSYSARFALRLRELRKKTKLAAQELAKKMGVIDRTIYHWETGHSFPKPEQLPLLAEALKLKNVRIAAGL